MDNFDVNAYYEKARETDVDNNKRTGTNDGEFEYVHPCFNIPAADHTAAIMQFVPQTSIVATMNAIKSILSNYDKGANLVLQTYRMDEEEASVLKNHLFERSQHIFMPPSVKSYPLLKAHDRAGKKAASEGYLRITCKREDTAYASRPFFDVMIPCKFAQLSKDVTYPCIGFGPSIEVSFEAFHQNFVSLLNDSVNPTNPSVPIVIITVDNILFRAHVPKNSRNASASIFKKETAMPYIGAPCSTTSFNNTTFCVADIQMTRKDWTDESGISIWPKAVVDCLYENVGFERTLRVKEGVYKTRIEYKYHFVPPSKLRTGIWNASMLPGGYIPPEDEWGLLESVYMTGFVTHGQTESIGSFRYHKLINHTLSFAWQSYLDLARETFVTSIDDAGGDGHSYWTNMVNAYKAVFAFKAPDFWSGRIQHKHSRLNKPLATVEYDTNVLGALFAQASRAEGNSAINKVSLATYQSASSDFVLFEYVFYDDVVPIITPKAKFVRRDEKKQEAAAVEYQQTIPCTMIVVIGVVAIGSGGSYSVMDDIRDQYEDLEVADWNDAEDVVF